MAVHLENLESLVQPVAEGYGVDLYDIVEVTERGRRVIRITVDVPGASREGHGVTIDQCAGISREVGDILDEEDAIDGVYSLEVSSPGVERLLTRGRHFRLAVGEYVRIYLNAPVEGRSELHGILLEGSDDGVRVALRPKKKNLKKGQIEKFPPLEEWATAAASLSQIQKAQTLYEL